MLLIKEHYDDKSFWDKKVIVSYILSVFVFFIHNSSFGQYTYDDGIVSSVCLFLNRLWMSIAQVAVPLFMIIAGALFFRNYEQKLYPRKLKKRAKSLLVPYLTWNTLSMLFNMAATLLLAKYFIARQPFDFSVESVLKSIFCYEYNVQFWFVADLMIYIVLSPVIYVLLHNKLAGGGYLLLLTIAYSIGWLPDAVLFDSSSIIYFSIGAYIGMHYPQLMKLKNAIPNFLSVAIIVISVVWSYFRIFYSAALTGMLTDMGFLLVNFIVRLAYCFAFWSIIDVVLPKLLPVKEFYNHSFWVYAMHVDVGGIVANLLFLILPKCPIFSVVNHFLNMIITLSVISLIAIFLKKKWRPAYDVLSGSRG